MILQFPATGSVGTAGFGHFSNKKGPRAAPTPLPTFCSFLSPPIPIELSFTSHLNRNLQSSSPAGPAQALLPLLSTNQREFLWNLLHWLLDRCLHPRAPTNPSQLPIKVFTTAFLGFSRKSQIPDAPRACCMIPASHWTGKKLRKIG